MTKLNSSAVTEEIDKLESGESLWQRAFRRLRSQKQVVFCTFLIGFYILIAVLAHLGLIPDFQTRVGESYEMPSFEFAKCFGTDIFGRSTLYKVLAGAKTAVTMGFIVTVITIPWGVALGAVAGYFGGRIDQFIIWFYSVVASIPGILLIIGVSYTLGKGLLAVCIAMAATYWVGLCRLIRGEFIKHKNLEYVLAARLFGAGHFSIIVKHLLPNVLHLAIVTASLMVLSAIKSEVLLTYIGVGIQDGASWGTMIADAPGELVNGIWWPLTCVILAMFFIIYPLNVLGDALRDSLDPKLLS